jgi:hypothetical protein
LQQSNYSTNDHKRVDPKILLRLLKRPVGLLLWRFQRLVHIGIVKVITWGFKDVLTEMDAKAFADLLTQPGGPGKMDDDIPNLRGRPKSFRDQPMPLQTPDISGEESLDGVENKNLVVRGEDWVTACKLYRAVTLAYMEMIDEEDIPQCLRDLFDIIAQYDAINGNHMGAWENSRKRLETLQDELDH